MRSLTMFDMRHVESDDSAMDLNALMAKAEQNNPVAQCILALRYETGHGVKRNMRRAVQLLVAAADQHEASAQYRLALLYKEGRGVEKNLNEAALLFRQAADHNMPEAMYELGKLYHQGLGVPVDHRKALRLWGRAAQCNHTASIDQIHAFAHLQMLKSIGSERDGAVAFDMLMKHDKPRANLITLAVAARSLNINPSKPPQYRSTYNVRPRSLRTHSLN